MTDRMKAEYEKAKENCREIWQIEMTISKKHPDQCELFGIIAGKTYSGFEMIYERRDGKAYATFIENEEGKTVGCRTHITPNVGNERFWGTVKRLGDYEAQY